MSPRARSATSWWGRGEPRGAALGGQGAGVTLGDVDPRAPPRRRSRPWYRIPAGCVSELALGRWRDDRRRSAAGSKAAWVEGAAVRGVDVDVDETGAFLVERTEARPCRPRRRPPPRRRPRLTRFARRRDARLASVPAMAFPTRLLVDGEELILDLRPHWIALVLPTIATIATIVVMILLGLFDETDPRHDRGRLGLIFLGCSLPGAAARGLADVALRGDERPDHPPARCSSRSTRWRSRSRRSTTCGSSRGSSTGSSAPAPWWSSRPRRRGGRCSMASASPRRSRGRSTTRAS